MKNIKGLFSMVIILFWFSLYTYVPQVTNYAKELGASYKMIGLIGGAFGLSQTLLRMPIGIASDILKKRKVFVIAGILFSILSASIIYLFPNPYSLLLGRFIAGIAASTWVSFIVLFISYYDSDESGKAVGIVNANSKLGQLMAMFIGGFISLKFGIKIVLIISIIVGIIAFILSLTIHEKQVIVKKSDLGSKGILEVIKNRNLLYVSLLASLGYLITYSTTFGFTPIIASNLGANDFQLGLLPTLFNLPQVLFSILAGTLILENMGHKNALMLGFGLTSTVCFLTPIAPNLYILYVLQLIAGIGNSIAFALLMTIAIEDVQEHLRTTAVGLFQGALGIGMVLGPIVLGSVGDLFGLTTGFILIGVLGLLGMSSLIFYFQN